MINTTLLLLIEHHLQDLASILLGAQPLADNLNGKNEVGEDRVVDGSECSGTGTLLSERGARAVGALGAGKDAARGEDQDVAVGELLLELTGEAGGARQSAAGSDGRIGSTPVSTYRC